ncbi:AAA-domain-containing protein [Corynespora cassiicola Philippines]|uniref:AAA-domain-containing protein n=1 Tax=Corynespora cassiicola Philippines TaxID=1448308 RepID=A0A2T2N8Q3_CORCC|nr:AAA-domain-containing protein [Corynespora cassiicola Philippines]
MPPHRPRPRAAPQPEPEPENIMEQTIRSAWTTTNAPDPAPRPRKRIRTAETTTQQISITPPTGHSLDDLGGVDKVIDDLKEHLVIPLLKPSLYEQINVPLPTGILLYGPPGCGKTAICKAFAARLGVSFVEIAGPAIVSGVSGDSEKLIREHFERAKEAAPSILFIDEIDVIAPKRSEATGQMDKRMVGQILVSMDHLAEAGHDGKPVVVIAATNRPESLDSALRRGGRFGTEINMGVPNEQTRAMILKALTRKPNMADDVDFNALAKKTAGFVGADLHDLVSKAGNHAVSRMRQAIEDRAAEKEAAEKGMDIDNDETNSSTIAYSGTAAVDRLIRAVKDTDAPESQGYNNFAIAMADFDAVLPGIVPSSKREGFSTVPDVTWNDVGAPPGVRESFEQTIVKPIQESKTYRDMGIDAPSGVLLWGPPGCGKTLLAKAVAAESGANFISVKGAEILSKYVGDSERAIRQIFTRARSSVPCVVFFDEMDALVPKRTSELHEASSRVVNALLAEMDGTGDREGIYIVGASNRPEMIDDAILRPGRMDHQIYIGLPDSDGRVSIMKALLRKKSAFNIDLADVAKGECCEGFSGADLGSMVRLAGQFAKDRGFRVVSQEDMARAAGLIQPSVRNIKRYEELRARFERMFH